MPQISKYTAAGFDGFQWGLRSPFGYFIGVDGLTSDDEGVSSSMLQMEGAVSAPTNLPTPTVTPVPGDDGVKAYFLFESNQPVQFSYSYSVRDFDFLAAIRGLSGPYAEAYQELMAFGPQGLPYVPFMGLFSRRLKSMVSGQRGAAGYEHLLLLNLEYSDVGAGRSTQGVENWSGQITANPTDRLHDGRLVTELWPEATGGIIGLEITSSNRLTLACLVGDGTETVISMPQKPISADRAFATLQAGVDSEEFAETSIASVQTTEPYGITLDAAPGAGRLAIVRAEIENYA